MSQGALWFLWIRTKTVDSRLSDNLIVSVEIGKTDNLKESGVFRDRDFVNLASVSILPPVFETEIQ